MSNFYRDNDDLQFYLERGVDWEPIVELTENGFSYEDGFDDTEEAIDFYESVLEMVGRFVAEEVAPHAMEMDREGLELVDGEVEEPEVFDQIFDQIEELELHGLCLPRELGGMNCPMLLYTLTTELFARADVSVSHHHGFHGGMAVALLAYSVSEGTTEFDEEGRVVSTRFENAIEEIIAGEAWGSMDITEPGAGSDLSKLRTKGYLDEDGQWRVDGQKIWITSGHGKYHVVLARTEEDEEGLDALSTFLVQTYEEDEEGERVRHATVERLAEKMGHHASATCVVRFDETPAQLIGERGDGFRNMLLLMNNARVAVGIESVGVCEDAFRLARDYAEQRETMGKPIARHEMIADYLDEMKTEIQGMRALGIHSAYCEEYHRKLEHHLEAHGEELSEERREELEEKRDHYGWEARRLTPLIKYLAGERAVQMSRMAIQIHGGAGYTKEYEPEKLLRDATVMPIYEGTSQIQALMATKDRLAKILEAPQEFLSDLARARWESLTSSDPLKQKLAQVRLSSLRAQRYLISKTAVDKVAEVTQKPIEEWPSELRDGWDPDSDFAHALLHAERLIKLLVDEAVCELLYEQATEYPDRRDVFERYVERAIPRCEYYVNEITSTGERLLEELHGGGDDSTPAAAE